MSAIPPKKGHLISTTALAKGTNVDFLFLARDLKGR
jgi:hypothetical protein